MKVGGRMFFLTDINSDPPRINLKCDPALAEELRKEYPCIVPGYHMNKVHWNTVILDGTLSSDTIVFLIDHSYDLVVKGLPRRIREGLEGEGS